MSALEECAELRAAYAELQERFIRFGDEVGAKAATPHHPDCRDRKAAAAAWQHQAAMRSDLKDTADHLTADASVFCSENCLSTEAPAGLDEERLARALFATQAERLHGGADGLGLGSHEADAAEIADAYRRDERP